MLGEEGRGVALLIALTCVYVLFLTPPSSTANAFLPTPSAAANGLPINVSIENIDISGLKINTCWFAGEEKPYDNDEYTPTPAEDYIVNCSVTVYDENGYQDIDAVWASWHYNTTLCEVSGDLDDDVCYLDNSCGAITGTGTGDHQDYHCNFGSVKYYADYRRWNFTVDANDTSNTNVSNQSYNRSIGSLLAFNQSTSSIDFPVLAPGATLDANVDFFIENQGNRDFSVTVQANEGMSCSVAGSIPVGNVKYDCDEYECSGDGTAYASACGVLSTSNEWNACASYAIYDEEEPVNTTKDRGVYWGIGVPEGVSGTCNNTITFTAN